MNEFPKPSASAPLYLHLKYRFKKEFERLETKFPEIFRRDIIAPELGRGLATLRLWINPANANKPPVDKIIMIYMKSLHPSIPKGQRFNLWYYMTGETEHPAETELKELREYAKQNRLTEKNIIDIFSGNLDHPAKTRLRKIKQWAVKSGYPWADFLEMVDDYSTD